MKNSDMMGTISGFYKNYYHDDLGNRYILNELLRYIPNSGSTILDLGCGTGSKSKYFKKNGNVLIGVDISARQIIKARVVLNHVIITDTNSCLPFRDGKFDIVYCSNVLEHLFDFVSVLKEINRVLKPYGTIIIEVPNVNYWPNRLLMLFGKELIWIGIGKHIRAFNKSNLKRSLVATGFKDIKIFGSILPIPRTGLKIYLPYFNRILPGLCLHLIAIAMK